MKTDALIDLLSRGAGPAPRREDKRRLVVVVVLGLLASTGLALWVIGPVPAAMLATPAPWIKLAYSLALAWVAAWLMLRLAKPVARVAGPSRGLLGVAAAMAALGLAVFAAAPASERLQLVLGHSWQGCPINVLLLSLPGLAAALWALRTLAPTRLRAAGAAAGVLAGALGALGYGFACTETSATFVAIWYTVGVALTAGLGALLGPRVLRW